MKTPTPMKLLLALVFLFLLYPVQADVYVSPEEHREWAKQGLEQQLAGVPADKQVEFVEDLLAKIPQERLDLELKISMAEKAESEGGDRTGPPTYFLRKGFESIKYKEIILKEWLTEHGKPPKAAPGETNGQATPSKNTSPGLGSISAVGAPSRTALVALVFLAAGVLLGLRRALARPVA